MSHIRSGDGGADALAVVLSAECRGLRRALRPLVWVTLEEVALDAVVEDGRLLARTSARQVAERLDVDPGTAAAALRVLRARGLVALEREKGPAGRFGLSVYDLAPVAGLSVVRPRAAGQLAVSPQLVATRVEPASSSTSASVRGDRPAPGMAGASVVVTPADADPAGADAPHTAGSAERPAARTVAGAAPARFAQCPPQERFDLGWVAP